MHRNSWTRTTDNRVFTKVLYGIIKFVEMVVFPSKTVLLLDQIPQILRNKLYREGHIISGVKNILNPFPFTLTCFPGRDVNCKEIRYDIIMVTPTVTSLRCLT